MNYFLSGSFMLFLALLFLVWNVLLMDIKREIKYVFSLYIFFTALTLLFRIYASFPFEQITEKGLWFWYSFSTIVNSLLPFLTLHFILVISERGKKYNTVILSISSVLSLVFCFAAMQKGTLISGFIRSEFGYLQIRAESFWVVAFSVYYSLSLLTVILLCFEWRYKYAKSELEKKQAQFMLISNILIFICAFIIYGYLGGTKFKYNHFMGSVLQTMILAIYGYAIFRYRLLDARGIAAKSIIKNMSEIFILSDNKDDSIVEVNEAAVKLLGYAENDILEKKVKDIVFLNTNPLECSLTGYESKDNASGQYEGYLRTINGKRIPVEFNFSGVKVDKMGFLGTVIVANDVSEILGYIERQKDKNREINITYAELKKKRDFMKRFQKITGERDEQKQKLKRELAGLKIKTVLNGEGEV